MVASWREIPLRGVRQARVWRRGYPKMHGPDQTHIYANIVEREISLVALSRSAGLAVCSAGSGENWAVAITRMRMAILNGINPQAGLMDVLERMVRGKVYSTYPSIVLPYYRTILLRWSWSWRLPCAVSAA